MYENTQYLLPTWCRWYIKIHDVSILLDTYYNLCVGPQKAIDPAAELQ